MTTKRMLTSELYEDDFFIALDIFSRFIWIGLITGCADDQGRLQDNAVLIRSKIFPTDDIQIADIQESLNRIHEHGKIVRYIANGKKLIQIVNWWKNQSPRWAGKSNYDPPEGWIDRERYHGAGNAIITKNWDSIGGYIADYTTREVKVKVKVKVNGEDDTSRRNTPDKEIEYDQSPCSPLEAAFVEATSINGLLPSPEIALKAYKTMQDAGVIPQDIHSAVRILQKKRYSIVGPSSVVNTAISEMSVRVNAVKDTTQKGYTHV